MCQSAGCLPGLLDGGPAAAVWGGAEMQAHIGSLPEFHLAGASPTTSLHLITAKEMVCYRVQDPDLHSGDTPACEQCTVHPDVAVCITEDETLEHMLVHCPALAPFWPAVCDLLAPHVSS